MLSNCSLKNTALKRKSANEQVAKGKKQRNLASPLPYKPVQEPEGDNIIAPEGDTTNNDKNKRNINKLKIKRYNRFPTRDIKELQKDSSNL